MFWYSTCPSCWKLVFFMFSMENRCIWPNNHEQPSLEALNISSSLKIKNVVIPIYTCDQDSQLIKFGCSVKIFFTFSHWWSLQSSRNLTPREVDSVSKRNPCVQKWCKTYQLWIERRNPIRKEPWSHMYGKYSSSNGAYGLYHPTNWGEVIFPYTYINTSGQFN